MEPSGATASVTQTLGYYTSAYTATNYNTTVTVLPLTQMLRLVRSPKSSFRTGKHRNCFGLYANYLAHCFLSTRDFRQFRLRIPTGSGVKELDDLRGNTYLVPFSHHRHVFGHDNRSLLRPAGDSTYTNIHHGLRPFRSDNHNRGKRNGYPKYIAHWQSVGRF